MSEVYKFKAMSEVELLEEPGEGTTVLAVENGAVKQIPAGKFGGGGAGSFIVTASIDLESDLGLTGADKTFAEIVAAIDAGAVPVLRIDATPVGSGYMFASLMQMLPENGVMFSTFIMAANRYVLFGCTPDDQWIAQELGAE